MPTGKLHIVPLGGLGEFGMNCMALRWGDDIIVIDAGLMFPEAELLGVDIVVPDMCAPSCSRTAMKTTSALCPGF
jgi:ribonuclease J